MFGTIYVNGQVFKHRTPKGFGPWVNWFVNRGHFGLRFTEEDLRRKSWRRKF